MQHLAIIWYSISYIVNNEAGKVFQTTTTDIYTLIICKDLKVPESTIGQSLAENHWMQANEKTFSVIVGKVWAETKSCYLMTGE